MPNDPARLAAQMEAATEGALADQADFGFAEPWQARAFAIAVLAAGTGCFTWSEWSHTLGGELRTAASPESEYFERWLAALQSLLVGKGAVTARDLAERRRAWEEAYRRTPHGAPVSLATG